MKMKIIAMGVLCMVCLYSTAQAQVTGVKGGISINNVSGMSGSDRVSGYAGLYFTSPLSSGWYVQPEILYSGEGQRYQTSLGERILALSYLKVPVMFQFYPAKQVYVELGPQLGILTSAVVKDTQGNRVNVGDSYKRLAASLGFGVGVKASDQVGVNIRYNLGLTDITANENTVHYSNNLQLGIGIRIK